MQQEKFEIYAIVELFGHNRIAGKVSDQTIGGSSFVRIDVPQTKDEPAWTRFLHPNAIYAINPVSEDIAQAVADRIKAKPIDIWDAEEIVKRVFAQRQLEKAHEAEPFSSDNGYNDDPHSQEE